MKRATPASPSLARRVGFVAPKVELVIACEGRNTEPRYIEDCVDYYGAGLVRLRLLSERGVPLTVVKAAVEEREMLLKRCRRSPDSFDSCFRVWAIFDRDEHPNVEEALAVAADNKIDVAFSNPCFEVWPLLHLEDYGAQDGRGAVQQRLRGLMPKYEHDAGAIVDFNLIRDGFEAAFRRAELLLKRREEEDCPLGNPSTTVGRLVSKIVQNGKRGAPKR